VKTGQGGCKEANSNIKRVEALSGKYWLLQLSPIFSTYLSYWAGWQDTKTYIRLPKQFVKMCYGLVRPTFPSKTVKGIFVAQKTPHHISRRTVNPR